MPTSFLPPRAPGSGNGGVTRSAKLLAALVAVGVGSGVLAAGVLAPGVAVAGNATRGTVGLFNDLPEALAEQPLSQQSRILFADGSPMATFYYQNRIVVGLDRMAQPLKDAIVAIEDSRFYDHGGVDPRGVVRAGVVNAVRGGGSSQGASTLTQQWVKNVLVEQAVSQLPAGASVEERGAAAYSARQSEGAAGYARKLREVKLAIAAEKQLTKEQILERYLNIADFGDGQYGAETASRHYFNKSAADLSVVDGALLAGIVQRPTALNPTENPVDSTARRDVVLARMLDLGKIDRAAYDAAVATPIEAQLDVQNTPNGCDVAGASGYFCDFAVRHLLADPAFGADAEQRALELYRGGLTITTTLDPGKQQAAVETVNSRVPNDASGVAASIVSIEPGSGKVVAMAQNRTYTSAPEAPAGSTSINYNVDLQSGGGRGWQPGSNFKPFVLATWLSQGKTLLADVEAPSERTWPGQSFRNGSCSPGPQLDVWKVRNAGDGAAEGGRMSVMDATSGSVNTAYSAIEQQLELCDVQAMTSALGVVQADTGEPVQLAPSMALGAGEVAPLAIANAYATFAAQGTYCRPLAITAVVDSAGGAVPVTGPSCAPVMSADVANGVTYALRNTLTKGTARGQGLQRRVAAGKTGTTNLSVATWFTGYTPSLSTSVWIGFPDASTSLNGVTIDGRRHRRMYGGTVAAPTWREYMDRALEGTPAAGFTDPPRSIIGTPTVRPKPTPTPTPSASRRRPSSSPTAPAPPAPPAQERAPEPAPEPPVAPGTEVPGEPPVAPGTEVPGDARGAPDTGEDPGARSAPDVAPAP